MVRIRYATPEDDAQDVPADERCIWPGCARRRAPGRSSGSGRQPEYCEKASRAEDGGGPEHNARNRWALRERQRGRAAGDPGDAIGPGEDGPRDAGHRSPESGPGPGQARGGAMALSAAKLHASDLLEQARRQHAGAVAAMAAERELYEQLAGQFQVMTDPAVLDLEIAAVTLKAGREVAQAAEDTARARQAQLAAHRDRDEAITAGRAAQEAAEHHAAQAAQAGRALAAQAAEHGQERDRLARAARDAGLRADSAEDQATRARKDADRARREADAARQDAGRAREQAEQARAEATQARERAEHAKAEAARHAADAAGRADAAVARADEAVRSAQDQASAERERAEAASRGRAEAARQLDAARAAGQALRAELAAASARADGQAERHRADLARCQADAGRLTAEIARLRAERDQEITRLAGAHQQAIEAERARAHRAEAEIDALRVQPRAAPGGP